MSAPNPKAPSAAQDLEDIDPAVFFDASPVATLVINAHHVVTHFNQACAATLGVEAHQIIGKNKLGQLFYGHDRPILVDLIVDGAPRDALVGMYGDLCKPSLVIPGAYEGEGFFPRLGEAGMWLSYTAAPLCNSQGKVVGAIETILDVTKRKTAEAALLQARLDTEELVLQRTAELARANQALRDDALRRESVERELLKRNADLNALNAMLRTTQDHLMQSEKLASIGQLAAGVAHEINNPIGYIFSNFGTLEKYLTDLFRMLQAYEAAESTLGSSQIQRELAALRKETELDFLKDDIPTLMRESREGIVRVRKIVQDLKDFSRVESSPGWQFADLHEGINSTLNVINNEVKYKADVLKEYGDLPPVQCIPSQINQVVMNLVLNAAQAMGRERGQISIRTGVEGDQVWLEVTDTGAGIPTEVLPRIFEPFFTTKPVGKGTGLGLSLSYGLIQKHRGHIGVQSEIGQGTTFRVTLPILQPAMPAAEGAKPT